MSHVIGIGHDLWISSAALFNNGKFTNAIAEERLNRLKGFQGFPTNSINYITEKNQLNLKDIDMYCVGWNPSQYFKCLHPRFSKTPRWRAEMLYAVPNNIISMQDDIDIGHTYINIEGLRGKFAFYDHHKCHSYCSHSFSSFESSINISLDGRGERKTSSINTIINNKFEEISNTLYPYSLGLFYGSFTQFCGFRPHSDEWKFMALGALSTDDNEIKKYTDLIKKVIWLYLMI